MTITPPAAVIILAAGQGTRMRSALPKVLHAVGGRSLLGHTFAAAQAVDPQRICVVVRQARDQVAAAALALDPQAVIADQDDVPGTGRAAQCGLLALDALAPTAGAVLVTGSDAPLLDGLTLARLCAAHAAGDNAVTLLTTNLADPHGYGRVLREPGGAVAGVIEQRDASEAQRAVTEINAGVYVFDT
ncbi:MAG: NTP transferase domain-containing protein, partial [Promicromonosporaceae bacterium]|nr:NTP transferase domain-containing protein [Promicromonosporaceae bacterium]